MFRSITTIVSRPNPFTRWASLGQQAKARLPITRRPQMVPVRFLANLTGDNIRYKELEPRIERKLGEYEDYLFEGGREKGWNQIMQLVSVQSKKELSAENIRRAFVNLQRRHTALRMAVISKDGKNYFVEVPDAPDLEILLTSDSRAVMTSEEHKWFDFGQLLWRCKILQPKKSDQGFLYQVLFIMQASMTDGTVINDSMLPNLVEYLEASLELKENLDLESLPLLPARESLLDQYGAILDKGDAGQNTQIENEISQRALGAKFFELHKPSNPHNCSGVVEFVLDQEQVSQLRKALAQRDLSMNSACVAANAMAVYKILTNLGADLGTMSLPSPYVVDLRRYAIPKHPTTHSGAYVILALNNIKLTAEMAADDNRREVLWKLATSIKKETTERLANNEPLFGIKKFLGFYKQFQSDREAFYHEGDLFYISNLGHIPVRAGKGNVTIKKMLVLKGAREPAIWAHNILSLDGKLQWEISYSKMLVSDDLAETYLSLVKEELERFL